MSGACIKGGDFAADAAAMVGLNVQAARSVLRAVILALEAVDDGAISFADQKGVGRWGPAMGEVCVRLAAVRSAFVESTGAPAGDWFTPLALAEALDAALWHGDTAQQGGQLDSHEVISCAQVVIDSLDALTDQLEASGLAQAA